jgi:hypothetical protein
MADYRFLTTWVVDAPIERVWEALEGSGTFRLHAVMKQGGVGLARKLGVPLIAQASG